MIELRIEGQNLDLDDDSAASITAANPALDPERLGRAYTYPFRVPHTPRNLSALKHQHRIDASTNVQEQPAAILIGGLPFVSGRAIVAEHTHRNTEVTVQNEDLSSLEKLSDIKLHDLLGSIDIPQNTQARVVFSPTGTQPSYFITINGETFIAGEVNDPLTEKMLLLAQAINDGDIGVTATYNIMLEELELVTTLAEWNIVYSDSFFSLLSEITPAQAREANMQAFLTSCAVSPRADVSFPMHREFTFYGKNRNRTWSGYFNWRWDSTFYDNEHNVVNQWFRVSYKPFVRLRYLLNLIADAAGLKAIEFDLDADLASDLETLLVHSNYALDEIVLEQVLSDNMGMAYMLAPHTSIDLRDHVLDISASDLLARIVKNFNLHYQFQSATLFLRRNQDQLQTEPLDWTNYTGEEFERSVSQGGGVTFRPADADDLNLSGQADPLAIGNGANELELPAHPIQQLSFPNGLGENDVWVEATIQGLTGTSIAYDLETRNEVLRLVFDRGQQNDAASKPYHQASPLGAHFSLLLTGKNNLYETFWKGWTPFLFSPIITRTIWLPLPDLLHILTYASPLVRIYSAHGDAIALVRSVQFRVGLQGVGAAKVEFNRQG